jgi:hypothetical protein
MHYTIKTLPSADGMLFQLFYGDRKLGTYETRYEAEEHLDACLQDDRDHELEGLNDPDRLLADLALSLGFETIEVRNSDSLDFREVSITGLMKALRAAYDAGKASR